MVRASAKSRLIALLGMVVLVAAVPALGLPTAPLNAVLKEPEALAVPVPPLERDGGAPGNSPDGSPPTTLGRSGPLPSPEAMLRERVAPTGVELGQPKFSTLFPPKSGSIRGQLPAWLPRVGIQRAVFSQPSLHLLFCTWLT